MNSISVVVVPEVQQLPFEILGAPKRDLIQKLSPYRADQSFNERMRQRHLGYRLDLRHVENAEIGFPAMKLEQRVMIAAEVARPSEISSDCMVELRDFVFADPDCNRTDVGKGLHSRL